MSPSRSTTRQEAYCHSNIYLSYRLFAFLSLTRNAKADSSKSLLWEKHARSSSSKLYWSPFATRWWKTNPWLSFHWHHQETTFPWFESLFLVSFHHDEITTGNPEGVSQNLCQEQANSNSGLNLGFFNQMCQHMSCMVWISNKAWNWLKSCNKPKFWLKPQRKSYLRASLPFLAWKRCWAVIFGFKNLLGFRNYHCKWRFWVPW